MAEPKKIVIVAGPNGAGKTTFAQEFLPREAGCPDFINVDLIAAGLSPFDPERAAHRAGRLMLEEIHRRVAKGRVSRSRRPWQVETMRDGFPNGGRRATM